MSTVDVTQANFEDLIRDNAIVLLDFWAEWCNPCKAFEPIFEEASERHPDVLFGSVDTEAEPELAALFGIRSIPTLVAFREQVGVFAQSGALPPRALEELIGKVKSLDMDDVRRQVAAAEVNDPASP